MAFNSVEFAIFFCAVFALYYTMRSAQLQVAVLLISSLIFYGWSNLSLLKLLLFCILMNAALSWCLVRVEGSKKRLAIASLGIAINVSILGAFKYSQFLAELLQNLGIDGKAVPVICRILSLPLPIGISFYTFEAISLLVDCCKKANAPTSLSRHLRDTAAFISFFPHLVAGPIIRAGQFFPQLGLKRFRDIPWEYVSTQLIIGYFLKVVVADNLAGSIEKGFGRSAAENSIELSIILLSVLVRFFSDFAGYSYIALGLSGLLGYRLPVNFNWPFCSKSLSEFWTRWHISLSQWLRDYLYIPLGGNRLGAMRTYVNIMIVMLIGGMWHGAGVNFIVWGAVHGAGLCIERLCGLNEEPKTLGAKLLRTLSTFSFVTFSSIFLAQPWPLAVGFIQGLLLNWNVPIYDSTQALTRLTLCAPVLLWHAYVWSREQGVTGRFVWLPHSSWRREFALAGMMFLIVASPGDRNTFVYFQF